ncbi:MAG: protein kinase, partial [Planctomycetaceae bacterium]|nr:protein kinase [Planctomycetaceae bacterium]
MQPVLLSSFQQQQLTDENGMRTLYRAVDPSGQPVILCVFGSQASRNPEFRRLLKMDLQMLESLRHQAVPEFLGAGECEGCILTWQQDVDATTLHQLFQQGRVFSLEDIIEIGWQACSALQHAHNFGLSHGGLSDRCILLTDDLRVFVTDFGQPRWLAAVDSTSVHPSPTAGRDSTAALSRKPDSPGAPATENSTGVNNWRREVSGDLRSLARVLNAAIRREREMATASHAQSSPEIMGTRERTTPQPVEESGVSAHSLVRLLTRIEQHDEQAHPISARDF